MVSKPARHAIVPASPLDYDVIISGAGLIGAALAVALGRGGLRVLLLEVAGHRPRPPNSADRRTTAVAAASRQWLCDMALWRQAAREGGEIAAIRVSDRQSRMFLDFDPLALIPKDQEQPLPRTLGTIVENHILHEDFSAAIAELPQQITRMTVAEILSVKTDSVEAAPAKINCLTTGAEGTKTVEFTTHLLIATDGKNSPLRQMMGIESLAWDYDQTALVFIVQHQEPHQSIAHERFLGGGPLAFLPLKEPNQSSVVWTESKAVAAELASLNSGELAEELWVRFGSSLGGLQVLEPPKQWPLQFAMARRLVAPRFALAGDSAHLLHPIAGQGANLGWRDTALLARLIIEAKAQGLDIGSTTLLQKYEAQRWPDLISLSVVTNGLNRLFLSNRAEVAWLRSLGLGAVDHLPWLKKPLMLQAMGLGAGQ
ncbi:MAG: FAD-dependent monooxygenase [Candidatus Pacebacteria bacterium]|nr:FAD-dependent monooxygenase [Candidatus Paceibacterota bacterium]